MAVYDLEEQEQLDELKTWWKQHGNIVTAVLLAVAVGVAGWQGWNWWQRNQAAQASGILFSVQQAAGEGNAQHARELTGELIEKFPKTSHAGLAALLSAKIQVDKGDARNAKTQLQWAADNARDPAIRELARLRMAAILLDEKSHEDALKQLGGPAHTFAARYAELRGDVLSSQGKLAEARAAYRASLDQLGAVSGESGTEGSYREIVQTKLDSLGSTK